VVSLLNIVLLITPLISLVLSTIYFYNVREFIDLLLAQPVNRRSVFLGIYLGLGVSLSLGFVGGILLGMLVSGVQSGAQSASFLLLMLSGFLLTFIYTALGLWISVSSRNKLKGIALSLFVWLFSALLYDGLFLLWLVIFGDYPVERHAIVLAMLNPVDLTRIMVLLKLDFSALMGYTGAVFNKFFGTSTGIGIVMAALIVWVVVPLLGMLRAANRKDF
jgi:Cu-processing system permease protein